MKDKEQNEKGMQEYVWRAQDLQDEEKERRILRHRFLVAGGILLTLLLAVFLVPQSRQALKRQWSIFGSSEVAIINTPSKAEAPENAAANKNVEEGRNYVDYSVVHGTVTTVNEGSPGQQVVKDRKTLNTYRGFSFQLTLPEGMKAEELNYQDDYMKKKLTISFPLEYFDKMQERSVEGLRSNITKIRYKKSVDCGKLIVTFSHTYAFHYCVEKGVLYVNYGSPSYYYDRIVVIDPGHGGVDYGAYTWDKSYIEKEITMAVADILIRDFEKQDKVMVYYTRTDDTGVSLADRIGLANDIGADLFVSLHCNYVECGTAYGVETAYNQRDKGEPFNSEWLAQKMQDAFPAAMGLYSRGLFKGGNLRVLRLAKMPACLLEMGFITDSGDASVLSNQDKQQVAASTIETVIYDALEEMK